MVIAGREAAPTFSASAPRPAFLYIIISNGPFDCRELSYLLQFLMICLIPQLSKARIKSGRPVLCPIIFYLSIGVTVFVKLGAKLLKLWHITKQIILNKVFILCFLREIA